MFHHIPKPSLRNIFEFLSVNSFKEAELFWVKDAQQLLLERIEKGGYVRLCPKKTNEGIYVVCGRAEDWFKNTYNSEGLIFLPYNHRFSYLYAFWVHDSAHLGVAATVCKIRNRFWITQLPRMVERIRNKCVTCRNLNKKFKNR